MVIIISWINDNIIVGPTDLVLKLKNDLRTQFECDECGALTEYIGNKIEYVGKNAIKMVQTFLAQSYEDEFELGKRCYNVCVCVLTWAPAREDLFCNTRGFRAPLHGSPPPSLLITKVNGYLKATKVWPTMAHTGVCHD